MNKIIYVCHNTNPTFSILIPSMYSRQQVRTQILDNLMFQFKNLHENLQKEFEILTCIDNALISIGEKRNLMVSNANGKYVCFIDDDDIISDTYLESFVGMLNNDYDCSDLQGMYYKTRFHKKFYHSMTITSWSETNDCYLRCPNHLNMIRKSIVLKIMYKHKKNQEDLDFSTRLQQSHLIKTEFKTNSIIYNYFDIKNVRPNVSFVNFPLEISTDAWQYKFIKQPSILVKFPSRQRPQKLIQTLQQYVSKSLHKDTIHYMITLDLDDPTATPEHIKILEGLHKNIKVTLGTSKSKIDACNRDMTPEIAMQHDILLLASDDMIPNINEWDVKISSVMNSVFPGFDGVLHFNDGYTAHKLNTMCIMGSNYYNKFNYFYHPDYISLWCDNEFTDDSIALHKCYYDNSVVFKHEHPANTSNNKIDGLYKRNDAFFNQDRQTYESRKMSKHNQRKKNINLNGTSIPIIINNRNLVTWPKKMITKLKTLDLVSNIYIIDNNSNYGPLLEWYNELANDSVVTVIRLNKNNGHKAPWSCDTIQHLFHQLYVVTDADLNIDNLPTNILHILKEKLEQNESLQKIGLRLKTGPLFNTGSIYYTHIQRYEVPRWQRASIENDVATNVAIDTTFALYNSNNYFVGGGSYVHDPVIHEPWDFSIQSIKQNKEFLYYIYTSNESSSFKRFLNEHAPTLEKEIFDTTAYANYYADLKKAFYYNSEKLFDHWKRWGHSENRLFFIKS